VLHFLYRSSFIHSLTHTHKCGMSFLWEGLKATAQTVGTAAGTASLKTKLKTEVLLLDRERTARQQAFGVELYDHVSPLTKSADFFASDDTLTRTIRPPLLRAQREIAALVLKARRTQEGLQQAAVDRAAAFPTPAVTWHAKVVNAGKSTAMAGTEAKLKTELAVRHVEMQGHKQQFGVELYSIFAHLEDTQGWIPTNRDIRSIYDGARKDMEKIQERKQVKIDALEELGDTSYRDDASTPVASVAVTDDQLAPDFTSSSSSPNANPSSAPPLNTTPYATPLVSHSSIPSTTTFEPTLTDGDYGTTVTGPPYGATSNDPFASAMSDFPTATDNHSNGSRQVAPSHNSGLFGYPSAEQFTTPQTLSRAPVHDPFANTPSIAQTPQSLHDPFAPNTASNDVLTAAPVGLSNQFGTLAHDNVDPFAHLG
jgi:hypothetical protein